MKNFIYCVIIVLLWIFGVNCSQEKKHPKTLDSTVYQTDGVWIKGYNLDRYNNRPLYINNGKGFVLTGDKPLIRLVLDDKLLGDLIISLRRGNETKNLCDFSQITSFYAPGQMKWELKDNRLKNGNLTLNVLPAASGTGMVVRIEVKKVKSGDELSWSFGGGKQYPNKRLSFEFDVMGYPELLDWKQSEIDDEKPLFQGMFQGKKNEIFTLSFMLDSNGEVSCQTGEEASLAYRQAQDKLAGTVDRMKINTPDPYLNVIAKASVFAVDGVWYPPVFVHGGMIYNTPYPGWRTIFGGTMYGWHDRVLEQAKYYIATQVTESDKNEAKADPAGLMTIQHADSRFYGKGRIIRNQSRYNMQSQFFDQLIEDYRWTSDPELITVLREALELHLEWLRDCFDPDGDGTYESWINSWPSDSQWYNGGGSAEETSYAYRGHLAARDMARNAGDTESENYHNQMLVKIRKGFFEKLWITGKGHAGAYREQGGHERLHENPWLYSIFLPIDAGLTSPSQSLESVYYTEWALQNDRMPSGGRMVWSSNWTPGIWSVRERWPGDNYALALSYFLAGLPDDGMDIMRGTFMHTAFNHLVPGNLGSHQGGTDFGDCLHTFCRTLVTGLFGFAPDYPNGNVMIAPNFPKDWDYASIELPDVKIAFERNNRKSTYTFELHRKADMLLKLPVQSGNIKNVILNGKTASWELEPGIGCTMIIIRVKDSDKATISIEQADNLPYYGPVFMEGNAGEEIIFTAKDSKIVTFEDPQKVLENGNIRDGILHARLADNKGYHTVIAKVIVGEHIGQYRIFRVKINDPAGDAKEAVRYVEKIPETAVWETVDVYSLHNADIRTIYRQQYLSPRPNTVSVRLGTDGYSPWTFPLWRSRPPEIKTDNVINMLKDENRLVTPQGVPFIWSSGVDNVAFTSMWDNYPAKIDFPVNKTGEAVYFLVSGSTNVMQCQITNAVIRLKYVDGQTDSLELVPPVNYWNLSPIQSNATSPGQGSRNDYTAEIDRFVLPDKLPETVQLGENCRAMLLNLKMRKDVTLESITLETLSQEVVVGLIGVTIMK